MRRAARFLAGVGLLAAGSAVFVPVSRCTNSTACHGPAFALAMTGAVAGTLVFIAGLAVLSGRNAWWR